MSANVLTVDLAPDLLARAKTKAQNENLDMAQVIQCLLGAWVQNLIILPEKDTAQWQGLAPSELTAQIDAAYAQGLDADEQDVLEQMRYHQHQLIQNEDRWT